MNFFCIFLDQAISINELFYILDSKKPEFSALTVTNLGQIHLTCLDCGFLLYMNDVEQNPFELNSKEIIHLTS